MQDKTIAYVGDSLGRQMFQSMMCMVTGGKQRPDVEDVGAEYGFVLDLVQKDQTVGPIGFRAPIQQFIPLVINTL